MHTEVTLRVLLDTNVLIHREASTVVHESIGLLFHWLDRLNYRKCVHPLSAAEIGTHGDPRVRKAFAAKLVSYETLKTTAPIGPRIQALLDHDATENDRNDTMLLNELSASRVDYLITEDRGLARKADILGLSDRAFTIEGFLEKVRAENPSLADYKVLVIRKALFGAIDVAQPFFESLRQDYGAAAFDGWFNKKSDEPAYVCLNEDRVSAFLYLKFEGPSESYSDIEPVFAPRRRLKIGTLKAELNGFRLGERFLKIVFDNALRMRVDEIYVTIFDRSVEQAALIRSLEEFGFAKHGRKRTPFGDESVYVRPFAPSFNEAHPKLTYPFVSRTSSSLLVSIYPEYHTELLPDSILRTEDPKDLGEPAQHQYSIKKVYVCRSLNRNIKPGDNLVFYRTGGYHAGVVTTLGVVDFVRPEVADEEQFIRFCRKRSVFTDEQLRAHWRWKPQLRPFVVGFLYCYSFPKRPTLKDLIDHGVVKNVFSAPRGFEPITSAQFARILELSQTDERLVVD